MNKILTGFFTVVLFFLLFASPAFAQAYLSHPPMRPQPAASNRSMGPGPAYFADPVNGSDSNTGSQTSAWKTINYAKTRLQPGDTLYLRGGVYYEHITLSISGTATNPITIRSYPGELARVYFELARSAFEKDDTPKTVFYFEKSVSTYPNAQVYLNLSILYLKQGRLGKAKESLKEAKIIEPSHPKTPQVEEALR